MATPYHLEYLGFRSSETTRDYRLLVRNATGEYQEFTLAVEQKAFLSGRVRYQDAAEICFWKLQRALTAWEVAPESGPPSPRQTVTEADLLEYRQAHMAKPRHFSTPPPPPRPA
jgi:hypothetical protein